MRELWSGVSINSLTKRSSFHHLGLCAVAAGSSTTRASKDNVRQTNNLRDIFMGASKGLRRPGPPCLRMTLAALRFLQEPAHGGHDASMVIVGYPRRCHFFSRIAWHLCAERARTQGQSQR